MKKNLRALSLIMALLLCAGMLSACGGTKNEPTQEPGRTKLIVGFDASFPPYGFTDEKGEYVGFDLDLAAEVCARRGWELVKQPIDWDVKDAEINGGTIDCIWNGFTINGREDLYTWSQPYVDNSQVFVVAQDSGINTLDDLAGKVVAVQRESSAEAALNDEESPENIALRDSFAELLPVPDYNTAFMNLEAGAVDAVAMDIGVAKYQIAQRSGGFIILSDALAAEQYGVGFKLGNTELRDQVQETLLEMVSDGKFDEIVKKWDADYGIADAVILGK